MIERIKGKADYIASVCLSVILFYAMYGFKVLNPLYIDWILAGGDPTQHYLGWALYRYAPFRIRIGLLNTAAYPYDTSIIFTDSIPLFAIPCKFIGIFTDRQFQYFGIWGLACLVVMGICTTFLFKKFTEDKVAVVISSFLVTASPCLLRRIFWHSSLAAHFLIIIGLILVAYRKELCDTAARSGAKWAVLALLCTFTHPDFLAMDGMILLGYMIFLIIDGAKGHFVGKNHVLRIVIAPTAYCLSAVVSMWILGGFSSGMSKGAPGLGYYSFNLNGFFDPDGWSAFFRPLLRYEEGQYEGFAYLGLGILSLIFITIVTVIVAYLRATDKRTVSDRMKKIMPYILCILFVVLINILVSASNEVTFGDKLLFRFDVPEFISRYWDIFRASGRLIWPAVYIISIAFIIILYKASDRRFLTVVLVICAILQITDMNKVIIKKHSEFDRITVYSHRFEDDRMMRLMSSGKIRHIVFLDKDNLKQDELYAFTELATRFGLTVNDFYFARYFERPVEETAYRDILFANDDVMYVLSGREDESDEHKDLANMFDIYYYRYGDVLIGFKDPV